MIIVFHLFFFCLTSGAALLLVALSPFSKKLKAWRKSILIGVGFSPVGLIFPYLLFGAIVWICHGTWPPEKIPVVNILSSIGVSSLLILGPCVGPPLTILLVACFHWKRRKPIQLITDNSGELPLPSVSD